ncbi:MAG: guanylate kinase [Saprospiraceae bacterium]|jgi:guanylate kinase|nr:guanylate kinase [Saprospiraceae bacterium]
MSELNPNGKLLVFTAPSGAGKTTIVRHLLSVFPQLSFSVSAATRQQRHYEVNGVDYYFITEQEFKDKIEEEEFAEWEEVYQGQYYGTLRSEIDRLHDEGRCVIFDIDVNGALRLKRKYKENCLTVFVHPPSLEILIERLRKRNTETPESLQRRIDKASLELTYANKFDIILQNDDLKFTLKEAEAIVNKFLNV